MIERMNRRRFLGTTAGLSVAGCVQAGAPGPGDQGGILLDERFERTRRAALDVLKPSNKDLEHGLELHRNSIVFDAYGFAPRAAVDAGAFGRGVLEGSSDAELDDLREEMSMTRCVSDPVEQEEFKAAWRAAGVTCIFQNAGEEGQDPLRLLKRLARFTYVTDTMREFVSKTVAPGDVLAAKKEGRHSLCFTGNGVPLAQQWISAQDELRHVRVFFQLGIRMMHLTYNRRNLLGDGCAEPANAGLSEFGRQAIAEMNRVGVIVDVAHSGWRTSLEAAKASTKPVVASHTACAAVHRHLRGKPDEVLRAIADTGGYVGICCIPSFLGGTGDVGTMMDHLSHAVKLLGADHVAIGTDVAYTSRHAAAAGAQLPRPRQARARYEALWPSDPFVAAPKAVESMAWTNWPLFSVGLAQRGFSDEDIGKILGGNVLRVLGSTLR